MSKQTNYQMVQRQIYYTFNAVGVTPQILAVDKEDHLIKQWAYYQNFKDSEFLKPWNNYQNIYFLLIGQ
jgi:hypothetical protein